MKKVKFFGLAGFILLASGAGFSSCSSDSADPTGGTGVAGQVVKAQFAINIPYGNNSSTNQAKKVTRMTDAITQQSGTSFRGISDIILLTFSGDPTTTTSITEATSIIDIGTDGNAYDKDDYRRLYRDIQIPVGTSHMLFYGRATKENGDSEFKTGKITDNGDKTTEKTLANISHKLTPISSNANFTSDADAQAIIGALNNIAKANVEDNGTNYTWATIGNVSTPSWLTDHEKVFLSKRYTEFIKLKAGSKNSVEAFIKSLKDALVGESGGTVSADKKLTKEIINQCDDALTAIGSRNFPGSFNLPDGAATLSWNSGESTFAYNVPNTSSFTMGNTIDYRKICYPAELSYFVKTTTMVSDLDMSKVDNFPTYENWTKNTGADWTGKGFDESAVKNSTKTVGLKDPIQYSVAVLKSTVKCDAANLKDNAKTIGGLKEDQSITVDGNTFPITGILIGGQPESVDWKYEPASTDFANTIYDNVMNGAPMYAKNEANASNANYTLVFDNKNASNKVVYVTIELKNDSGVDFYGKDGVIPKGAKFYLVGKLDPTDKTESDHVFVQDYITKANFNIKNLKGAYNCIPDLRTSGINVGLAVDLSWKSGIEFNVDL